MGSLGIHLPITRCFCPHHNFRDSHLYRFKYQNRVGSSYGGIISSDRYFIYDHDIRFPDQYWYRIPGCDYCYRVLPRFDNFLSVCLSDEKTGAGVTPCLFLSFKDEAVGGTKGKKAVQIKDGFIYL